MNWKQWPFYPKSLMNLIGPADIMKNREGFISLLVSGCSERLGRPLTVLVPELDSRGKPLEEPDPDNPGQTRMKLRRIDQINLREHFAQFCEFLRTLPGQEEACQQCNANIARQAIQTVSEAPQNLSQLLGGYPCHMNLIDQVGVIRHYQTPVAVVFSGQFLPDEKDVRQQLKARIDELAIHQGLTKDQQQNLHILADQLETRDEFVKRYIHELELRDPASAAELKRQRPTVKELFLREVKEIQQIACAQFHMHKRERENEFRYKLRGDFPLLPLSDRNMLIKQIQPILEDVRRFCGSKYLALFISPQRYISFEDNPNILPPFAFTGIDDKVRSGILHFNWRKAGLISHQNNENERDDTGSSDVKSPPSITTLTEQDKVQQAIKNGLKGKEANFFKDATILCQISFADVYRAILLWGPFPHLTPADLHRESHFLEEVSELVMMRVLSSVQRSDSEQRTGAWEDIAGLLGHYSRRAMTPVSTGVRIIADYLNEGGTYSKEDALNATESLEAASRFISQAVRAPLFSFAAMAEEVYEFAPASLDTIVHDCISHYHPMALEKTVIIKVDPSVAELSQVEVDELKLRDAVGYVLDNAIKYSHEDKEVRIYGKRVGKHVRLRIEDFGQGIRDEELHLVFGRGYQGHRSRKAIYEVGEGMGLFHARLIVEAHKGKIWCGCRSGPRSGTSARLEGYRVWFTFELPIKQSDD